VREARALLASMRPRQWAKGLVLLAPLVFARRALDPAALGRALAGLLAFTLAAAATYLANDLADRERDRVHPEKRLRPVASGELPAGTAAAAAAVLSLAAILLAAALGLPFLACVLGYLLLQGLYSAFLRKVAVLDVLAIAAGFVLRVVGGAAAIPVPASSWLIVCTLLLALLLALVKRRAEVLSLGGEAARHRHILGSYPVPLLDRLVPATAAATLVAYALYTVAPGTVARLGSARLAFTVPFVLFGLLRYLWLAHRRGEGGQPERVLFRDGATQANLAGYLAVVAWAVYGSAR
jgi:4-hydroxybenzoate polyprenyltransferase